MQLTAEGFDLEFEAKRTERMLRGPVGYPCYRNIPTLYTALNQITSGYPALTQLIDFSDTWRKIHGLDGYDLYVLRLTINQTTDSNGSWPPTWPATAPACPWATPPAT